MTACVARQRLSYEPAEARRSWKGDTPAMSEDFNRARQKPIQTLRLWYTRPAVPRVWEEALPTGSSRLKGMVSGGVRTEHIQRTRQRRPAAGQEPARRPAVSPGNPS